MASPLPPQQAAAAAGTGGTIRVVVIGDQGTGKTSLIISCLTETFPDRPAPVIPPARLPFLSATDRQPLILVDTSSRKEDTAALEAECRQAHAIVVTYAVDRPGSLDSISTYWMPLLRRLQVSVPAIVVGCKLDRRAASQPSLEKQMAPIMNEFREIETCLECSALKHVQVSDVFFYAQKAVIHPTAPLFDQQSQTLRPKCVRALKRIFVLCDKDGDGTLNDEELNSFQVHCFAAPLQPAELAGVKRVVAERIPQGLNRTGLTLTGFLFLHALFIERGRLETTWTVLRQFGYADDLCLRPDFVPLAAIKGRKADQSVELSPKGLEFLEAKFRHFDADKDGALSPAELEEAFSTAPENPWVERPYLGAAETTISGGLTQAGFISLWSLMTLLNPELAALHLAYLGMPAADVASALHVSRRRRQDRKAGASSRCSVQCFLFGPIGGGKTALLDSFLQRPHISTHEHTRVLDRYAVNCLSSSSSSPSPPASTTDATKKPLKTDSPPRRRVLAVREIPEGAVQQLLSEQDSLAACDVAAFVYDSASLESWDRAVQLLEKVAGRAEAEGCELPCMLVAAKDDSKPQAAVFPHAAKVCAEMGLAPPLAVSARLGDLHDLWAKVFEAAMTPHLSIPETSSARLSKALRRKYLVSFAIGGATVAVVAIVAYKIYATRRSSS